MSTAVVMKVFFLTVIQISSQTIGDKHKDLRQEDS